MGRRKTPGLRYRNGTWHIDKMVGGRRIQQSTGTGRLEEAEAVLFKVLEDLRQATVFGVRPDRTFEEAAAKFVLENSHKKSLRDDVHRLENLMPHIGHRPLRTLHMGAFQDWLASRRRDGVAVGTINHGLQVVRRILNLAATEWVDDDGLTWLAQAPKIKLLPNGQKRKPYPLSWDEQDRLFAELPPHLARMALFKVNTGLRDSDVCRLCWDDEVAIPELGLSVFILLAGEVKDTNGRGDDRLVVLNSVAAGVIDEQRGHHATHVFAYDGKPVTRMGNSAWYAARRRAGLNQARVHDLKHTFGRRLRAAGVTFEDRQDLLGHRSTRVTTHYSGSELLRLVSCAERVVRRPDLQSPPLVVLKSRRGDFRQISGKQPPPDTRSNGKPLKPLVAEEGLEPPTRGL